MLALAARERVDLTVVGPELPLSLGVADRFAATGCSSFGPTARGRRLESSKAFAKDVHGAPRRPDRAVPTSATPPTRRCACVRSGEFGFPVVLKADGLAAGKGVVIAADRAEAEAAVVAAMTRAPLRRGRRHAS